MKWTALLIVAASVFLDTVVYGAIVPIVPLYLAEIGAPGWALGAVFATYSAGLLAGGVPFGLLADRWGRRPVLLLGLAGLVVTTLAFAWSASVWPLILSRLLQGLAAAAIWSAGPALVTDVAPPEWRGRYLSIAMTGTNLGTIVGPVFGGTVAGWFGRSAPFYVIAAAAAVLFFAVFALPKGKGIAGEEAPPTRVVLSVPEIRLGAVIITVAAFGYGILEPLLPGDLHARFGLDMAGVGIAFGIMSAAYTAVQPLLGWLADRRDHRSMILAGTLFAAILSPAVALAPTVAAAVTTLTIFGIAGGIMMIPCMPMMTAAADRTFGSGGYGVAFGIVNTAYSLGLAVGPPAATALANNLGLLAVMIAYSLVLLLAAGAVLRTFTRRTAAH
ncbi:MFS transporter [Kyrpidia tusciae]|uniref:Major facilitator superfamily MFS_1 n=1 Tax=Kyrpidia tusciae (strain DSM 2912 / NBRC 15312 / T2) TaxID=562970 RepID=D5WU39_KYRT2|nr:MFS transporter [Kyrpidia tusciae]ADG07291.1 major facilitator superfamily MFS_1 [Kyrpidia tusciae DSM 2912]